MNPQSAIFTFAPELSDLWNYLYLGIALLIAGIGIAVWASRLPKTEDKRKRLLVPYFGFILAIIAMMLIVGNFWQLKKYPTLTVSKTVLTINGEAQPMPSASQFRIDRENSTGGMWGKSQNILMLAGKDGITYALPEDRYDLQQLVQLLRKANAD